jgi:hypothetical protein
MGQGRHMYPPPHMTHVFYINETTPPPTYPSPIPPPTPHTPIPSSTSCTHEPALETKAEGVIESLPLPPVFIKPLVLPPNTLQPMVKSMAPPRLHRCIKDMCHMRRRIHVSYEEEDTCVSLGPSAAQRIPRNPLALEPSVYLVCT